jgi:membrane protease YdiL (CAAX protease family)
VHASNIFTEGSAAFLQAIIATASGLLCYVSLRVSGTLLVPIILHAGWDFSLFSGNIGIDPKPSPFTPVSILIILILIIVIIVRRRAIWPSSDSQKSAQKTDIT